MYHELHHEQRKAEPWRSAHLRFRTTAPERSVGRGSGDKLLRCGYQERVRAKNIHNTLALEQTIVNYVRLGDISALKKWFANAPAVRPGVLATDQLRQIKNTFIVTATLVSRAAIRGGMDIDDALSLSDAYIQKCELMSDLERITNLQYHMVLDYAEHVEKLRLGKSPSRLVLDVTNYIQHHHYIQ